MTTRGFGVEQMREVGRIIVDTLTSEANEAHLDEQLARGRALTDAFPLYPTLGR
jgi:glycine hydroxymethyltransferase